MRFFMIVVAVALFTDSIGQSASGPSLEVQISIDSAKFSASDCRITVFLRCKSFSDKNLILYGFDGEMNRYLDPGYICDLDRVSARFALFIYDQSGTIQYPEWSIPDSIDYKPMPKEKLDQFMKEEQLRYRMETRVIKGNETIRFERKIELADFHLRKGEYFLQLAYFSGKAIKKVVPDESQIERDKKTNNAELYQGCTLSNKISFRVN